MLLATASIPSASVTVETPPDPKHVYSTYMQREPYRASTDPGEDTILASVDVDKVTNRVLNADSENAVHPELDFRVAVTRFEGLGDALSLLYRLRMGQYVRDVRGRWHSGERRCDLRIRISSGH